MTTSRRSSIARRNLRNSTLDGCCYCGMMGLGELNIVVFAVALGYGEALAGLLGTVPLMGGAILQLISPIMVRRLGSHKRWIQIGAFVQACAFVPMAIGAAMGMMPPALLMLLAVVYWGSCFAAGSSWNTYIGVTVPRRVRTSYFAFRSRVLNVCLVGSMLLAGWLLHRGRLGGAEMWTFAGLFAGAAVLRWGSWWFTLRQTEPTPIPEGFRDVPLRELAGRFRHAASGRVVIYAVAAQLALQVSSPFVSPYLLEHLGLRSDYALFSLLAAAVLVAKVLALPGCAAIARAQGPRMLLRLGGIAIVPVPLLWIVSDHVLWLMLVQLLTGAALAAFELGVFLMFLESIPDGERTSIMCRYQVALQSASVGGSLLGAGILAWCSHSSAGFAWVFAASAGLRLATLPLLARVLPRASSTEPGEPQLELHAGAVLDDLPVLPTVGHSNDGSTPSGVRSDETRRTR